MAECPFCSSKITEQLSIHGGTCPSCFGEIPGEEAPTDPGAVVRARQEAEDAKTVQRSRLPLVFGAFGMLAFIAGAGWIATRPPEVVPVLDFDQLEFAEYEITPMADEDTEAAPVATPRPQQPRPSALERIASQGDPSLNLGQGHGGQGVVDHQSGTRMIMGPDGNMQPAGLNTTLSPSFGEAGGMSSDMTIRRSSMQGVTLTDDNDIIDMIRAVMEDGIPRLQRCYTLQLKTNESLRGNWVLNYTLLASGTASAITVDGEGVSDATMESCIEGKIAAWRFQPIKGDIPIRKTLRFRPR